MDGYHGTKEQAADPAAAADADAGAAAAAAKEAAAASERPPQRCLDSWRLLDQDPPGWFVLSWFGVSVILTAFSDEALTATHFKDLDTRSAIRSTYSIADVLFEMNEYSALAWIFIFWLCANCVHCTCVFVKHALRKRERLSSAGRFSPRMYRTVQQAVASAAAITALGCIIALAQMYVVPTIVLFQVIAISLPRLRASLGEATVTRRLLCGALHVVSWAVPEMDLLDAICTWICWQYVFRWPLDGTFGIPTYLVVVRTSYFVGAVPQLVEHLRLLVQPKVASFLVLLAMWAWIWSVVAVYCYSTCEALEKQFGSISQAFRFVLQLMTFDSWTAVLDEWDSNEIEACEAEDGGGSNCPPWMAPGYVYSTILVFGILFLNLFIGVLTEQVKMQSAATLEARAPRRETAAPVYSRRSTPSHVTQLEATWEGVPPVDASRIVSQTLQAVRALQTDMQALQASVQALQSGVGLGTRHINPAEGTAAGGAAVTVKT